jgi:hypothetical protein
MLSKLLSCFLLFATTLVIGASSAAAQVTCPCVEPNADGTAVLMPTTCPDGYLGFMQISNDLPPATTIDCEAELHSFFNNTEAPGGGLGGHTQTWDALLTLTISGTGTLVGFNRLITVQVAGISETSPRNPGDAVQGVQHDIASLSGELFGDPDFCVLRIKAGAAAALAPSIGQTTLTRIGIVGTDFVVDSFFDIQYTIEFEGCPGSTLEGMSGITENTHRFQLCDAPVPVEETTWGAIKVLYQ